MFLLIATSCLSAYLIADHFSSHAGGLAAAILWYLLLHSLGMN
ncbi:MAG TPA: hypothetical protein VHD36_08340 [Pirellulales bacterium]|nr:hypothetical protein [Pirellulales bacterium]